MNLQRCLGDEPVDCPVRHDPKIAFVVPVTERVGAV
jgi:hypothetical protein